jgi:hypothetical protein
MEASNRAYARGVQHAADIADEYNSYSTHRYRLGDCIKAKLNQTNRRPRLNKSRVKV